MTQNEHWQEALACLAASEFATSTFNTHTSSTLSRKRGLFCPDTDVLLHSGKERASPPPHSGLADCSSCHKGIPVRMSATYFSCACVQQIAGSTRPRWHCWPAESAQSPQRRAGCQSPCKSMGGVRRKREGSSTANSCRDSLHCTYLPTSHSWPTGCKQRAVALY